MNGQFASSLHPWKVICREAVLSDKMFQAFWWPCWKHMLKGTSAMVKCLWCYLNRRVVFQLVLLLPSYIIYTMCLSQVFLCWKHSIKLYTVGDCWSSIRHSNETVWVGVRRACVLFFVLSIINVTTGKGYFKWINKNTNRIQFNRSLQSPDLNYRPQVCTVKNHNKKNKKKKP